MLLATEIQHAAEEDDDDAFIVAVAEFFEALGKQRMRGEAKSLVVGVPKS